MFKIFSTNENENIIENKTNKENFNNNFNFETSATALYGPVEEEIAAGTIFSLLQYIHMFDNLEDDDKKIKISQDPFTFYISTNGGNTEDMFAIYDVIKHAQSKGIIIKTVGLGKVFSAGVVILSAGTPGYRFLGKNSRIMLHDIVIDGKMEANLHHVKNEIKEIKLAKQKYYDILKETTIINDKIIKKILKRRLNHYFSADEAIKYGIVDHIL